MVMVVHFAEQSELEPVRTACVHPEPPEQLVGQFPSHASPGSIRPLPHPSQS
jgi:hypothetical protein